MKRTGWLKRQTHRRVTVHALDSPGSYEGVLFETSVDGLVLIDASMLPDEGGKVSMAGYVFVPVGKVQSVQFDTIRGREA